MPHYPQNHPEFPPEDGESLHPYLKLLMTTVRDTVLSVVEGKKSVRLKGYKRRGKKHFSATDDRGFFDKFKQFDFPLNVDKKIKNTQTLKKEVKDAVHDALDAVGISSKHTPDKITTAIEALYGQYQIMAPDRVQHRLDNGKVFRDIEFFVGMLFYMGQLHTHDSLGSIVDQIYRTSVGTANFMTLCDKEKNPAGFGLKVIFEKVFSLLKDDPNGLEKFRKKVKKTTKKLPSGLQKSKKK